MTDETENRGHAFNQARTPIPRKPKPKSVMTDENLISEEAQQETVQTEEVKDVAEQEEVLESSSIEKRLAAIEEQMEVTNKYLSAIDWKI